MLWYCNWHTATLSECIMTASSLGRIHVNDLDDGLSGEEIERGLAGLDDVHAALDVGALLGDVVVEVDGVEGVHVHGHAVAHAGGVDLAGALPGKRAARDGRRRGVARRTDRR